jgi:hypothetical protein
MAWYRAAQTTREGWSLPPAKPPVIISVASIKEREILFLGSFMTSFLLRDNFPVLFFFE